MTIWPNHFIFGTNAFDALVMCRLLSLDRKVKVYGTRDILTFAVSALAVSNPCLHAYLTDSYVAQIEPKRRRYIAHHFYVKRPKVNDTLVVQI